jgi:hypothetical protein
VAKNARRLAELTAEVARLTEENAQLHAQLQARPAKRPPAKAAPAKAGD